MDPPNSHFQPIDTGYHFRGLFNRFPQSGGDGRNVPPSPGEMHGRLPGFRDAAEYDEARRRALKVTPWSDRSRMDNNEKNRWTDSPVYRDHDVVGDCKGRFWQPHRVALTRGYLPGLLLRDRPTCLPSSPSPSPPVAVRARKGAGDARKSGDRLPLTGLNALTHGVVLLKGPRKLRLSVARRHEV